MYTFKVPNSTATIELDANVIEHLVEAINEGDVGASIACLSLGLQIADDEPGTATSWTSDPDRLMEIEALMVPAWNNIVSWFTDLHGEPWGALEVPASA